MPTWLVPREELTNEQRRAVELAPEEHMVFLGGPGSGKTQVLLHRADHLRRLYRTPPDRFHIFVFTNVLKDYIRSALDLLDLPEQSVSTLDSWCCEYYEANIGRKLPWDSTAKTRDFPKIRQSVLVHRKANSHREKPFDFVLVDEGQDLDACCHELLTEVSGHVSVCMDHNQQIYDTGSTLQDVLEVLRLRRHKQTFLETYRCSPYIVDVASQYIDDLNERQQYIQQTRTSKTNNETPVFYQAEDIDEERANLIATVRVRISLGEKIAILLPQRRQVYGFAEGLRNEGLVVETPKEMSFGSDAPKIMPYHSAKGLTFETVLLPRLGASSFRNVSTARIRRLLFVGITRATRWVYLSTTDPEFLLVDPLRKLAEAGRVAMRSDSTILSENRPVSTTTEEAADDLLDFL